MTLARFILVLVLGWSFSALAEYKIGLVDMQAAIEKSVDGQHAKQALEADFGKRKKDLEKMEADLKTMSEDMQKKASVLSEDSKAKKQQEMQAKVRTYQEAVQKNQMEIQKRQKDLTDPIIAKIKKIIETIAKQEKLSLVQEKSEQVVLYSASELDLTDRVIKAYNDTK